MASRGYRRSPPRVRECGSFPSLATVCRSSATRGTTAPSQRHQKYSGSRTINGVDHELPQMTSIQPELWVDRPQEALAFYEAAFHATVLHLVGEGDDIVVQLGVGDAGFWVAPVSETMKRFSPRKIDGATSRVLLVVDDPDAVFRQALAAGATASSPVQNEHGWRLGRIIDPFGHEWEIGAPRGAWPP